MRKSEERERGERGIDPEGVNAKREEPKIEDSA